MDVAEAEAEAAAAGSGRGHAAEVADCTEEYSENGKGEARAAAQHTPTAQH